MKVIEVGLTTKLKEESDMVEWDQGSDAWATYTGNPLTVKLGGSYIYNSVAPQGQDMPYVVFLFAGGGAARFSKSDMRDPVYIVKSISGNLKEALELDELVEGALHEQTLTISGYTNVKTQRENGVQVNELADDGTMIFHRGAYYRIIIDD